MRETPLESRRLLQVFLSPAETPNQGIFEVSNDATGHLFCTCPGHAARRSCKHTRFVQSRLDANDGNYPFEISTRITDEEAVKANDSDEAFREFIIKFGKIEVY
jgi:hypothetical protein